METQPRTGLTYRDIEELPEERRELIEGELIVPSSPSTRHQLAVGELLRRLSNHAKEHGGVALTAPFDIKFSDINVLQPDVLFVAQENLARIGERFASEAPDLVIEVSSPSTRQLEHLRKREIFERYG
ncbi:MAG: Uma2 family endonuclease, partial [Actinomycetota bacterium]